MRDRYSVIRFLVNHSFLYLQTKREPMTWNLFPLMSSFFLLIFNPLLIFLSSIWNSQNYLTLGNRPSNTVLAFPLMKKETKK